MYVILPFEKQFYEEKHDYPVHFVGHPLLDAIADRPEVRPKAFAREHGLSDKPIVALLPGSRKQEITKMLGVMLAVVDKFPDHQFVIAGAPSQELEFYRQFIKLENVSIVQNRTYDLLSVANAALVTSGTATLETALFKVPEVVCYKGNAISYQIGKRLVQVEYISLVNLIMNREVVKELIQDDFNEKSLEDELFRILDHKHREGILDDYFELEKKLGGKGASENTAKLIIQNS
jgi:lipid-A-disaccharide synthase